ncbi:hypothetical protein U1Q18_031698 [Sarracenia purpurea var. burkii]
MAEKEQQAGYPMAPANVYGRSDVEAAGDYSDDELRRQKRKKCIRYVIAFAIFQIAVISLFSVTVMKVKTPKFRVSSADFGSFNVQTASPPSFNLMMNAELGVKNTNFGPYKFDSSTIYFYYGSSQVGRALIPNLKAGFKSTKKFTVVVDLTSINLPSNSNLATDLASGVLSLTSQSTLTGKVELMMIMKKKKTVNMNCTMDVNITTKELQNLTCN